MSKHTKKGGQRGMAFTTFLICTAVVAGLVGLAWPQDAYAGVLDWITSVVTTPFNWLTSTVGDVAERIAWALVILIFNLLATITVTFSSLAAFILQWVISPGFTTLSYTNPGGNPVIDVGLSVTQGFANMILVLVLVFIALAVILRVAGYEIKKLLPTFVLVALLVNFAPVLVGLIVDASNIVMNYFTSGLTQFTNWTDQMGSAWSGLITIFSGSKEEVRSAVFYSVAVSVFSFFIGIAFLVYAFIFIVRYVVIWVLTILAPLAFVLYILPATRGLTRKWWEQLVQWSFIGVTAGFFLYLSSFVIAGARDWFRAPPVGGLDPGIIGTILIYMVPMVFLYLGLAIGMSTSAMGASMVIRGSLKAQKWSAKQGVAVARGIRIGGVQPVQQAEAWTRKHIERIPFVGKALGGPGAYEKERERKLESARAEMKSIPDTAQGNADLRRRVNQVAITQQDRENRAAAMEILAQRKELNGITNMAGAMAEAQRTGADASHIYKARPDLARHLIDPVTGQPRGTAGIQWAMERIAPADFHRFVQGEALTSRVVSFLAARNDRTFEQFTRHARAAHKRILRNTLTTAPWTPGQQAQIAPAVNIINTDPRWHV